MREPTSSGVLPKATPFARVAREVDLPLGTALWVLFAHFATLLSPLSLTWVVTRQADALAARAYSPVLFHVATALLMAGSAFEIAQNTVDRWYLTEDVGSTMGQGFCDLACYWFIAMGMSAMAIAAHGDAWWVTTLALGSAVAFPFVYLSSGVPYPGLAVAGLNCCAALFVTFGDPSVFLQLVFGTGMLMLFFTSLMHTHNQVLHGCTTLSSAVGFGALIWSIDRPLAGATTSWTSTLITGALTLLACAAVRPWLRSLPATPRPSATVERAPRELTLAAQ